MAKQIFAVTFDDFKRRAESKNPDMEIKALCTAYTGSEEFESYWNLYNSEGAGDNLHLSMEVEPPNLGTFFLVKTKQKEVAAHG